jgi:phosphoserine phosphatase RsbU/P
MPLGHESYENCQVLAVLEEIIRRVPFFADLPRRHIRWLSETLQAQDILAGATLFSEGERGDFFCIILQGEFEISKQFADGGYQPISVRGPGEYVGEMALMHPQGLRTATVRALTDGEVLVMSRADFDGLLQRQPTLGYQLARVLSERLEEANTVSIRRLEARNRALQAALDELHAAQAELVEKKKLEHELALARDIQMSLLPPGLPTLRGFDFGARLLPMSQVGGDFYDFIPLDDDNLGISVGDVSGHGMPAALIMAITLALLRAEACRSSSPAEVLCSVNRELLKLGSRQMFVTVLYGVLTASTGEFLYARAGHEPPIVTAPGQAPSFPELAGGRLLGLFDEIVLHDGTLTLPPGGSLVMYTDGVVETRSAGREFFGEDRLAGLLLESGSGSAKAICDRVLGAVAAHGAGLPQQDDITVLCTQRLSGDAVDAETAGGF